jgi:hypothetical protein
MRCYGGRDATDVAVRKVQLLTVVGCSRSFGGTMGARLGYLCHTVFAASSAAVQAALVASAPARKALISAISRRMRLSDVPGHIGAAALDDIDQALSHQHAHGLAGSLPRYPVALHQRRLARDRPIWHQLPGLDLGAQDRRYLLVDGLRRLMIDGHAVTVPGHPAH